jgi:hypothetical protein
LTPPYPVQRLRAVLLQDDQAGDPRGAPRPPRGHRLTPEPLEPPPTLIHPSFQWPLFFAHACPFARPLLRVRVANRTLLPRCGWGIALEVVGERGWEKTPSPRGALALLVCCPYADRLRVRKGSWIGKNGLFVFVFFKLHLLFFLFSVCFCHSYHL